MTFTPKTWHNDPDHSTPLDAAGLIDMEARTTGYVDSLVGQAGGVARFRDYVVASGTAGDPSELTTALAAVRAAGGGTVTGVPGSDFKLPSSLIGPGTHGTLDLRGCLVEFTGASVQTNMLQSAALAPVATATDAATTVGSSVVVSPTLAPAAAAALAAGQQQQLAVVGAGVPGGDGGVAIWLYGTVLSVVGNNITLTGNANGVAAHTSGSGRTAYLFNRSYDVTMVGGTWDTGASWIDPNARSADWKLSNLIRPLRIDKMYVADMTLKGNAWTSGKGGVFGINPGDCTDFVIERIVGAGVGSVVQGDGPLRDGVVRDISGYSQDDLVAFGPVGASGNDLEGDIVNVRVSNVDPNGAWTAAKVFFGAGSNSAPRRCDVEYHGVHGSVQQAPCNAVDYPNTAGAPAYAVFRDVDCVPGVSGGNAFPQVDCTSHVIRKLDVEAKWPLPAVLANASVIGMVHCGGAATDGLMEVIAELTARGSAAASVGLYLNESDHSGGAYKLVRLDDYRHLDTGLTQQAIQIETNAAIDRVEARDPIKSGPGVLVYNHWAAPIKEVVLINPRLDGNASSTQLYVADTEKAGLATVLKVIGGYVKSTTNAVKALHALTAMFDGFEYDSTGLLCTAQGTNGTIRALVAATCKFNNVKTVVSPGAAQVVSANAYAGTADASKLTPQDGDFIINSNAAFGAGPLGTGPAIYSSTAAKWKHLYSGATS